MPSLNNHIKAVIFDLGNVLIDFDHMIAARGVLRFTDKNPEEIFSLFFDSKITGLFEEGKIAPLDFFSAVKEALKLKLTFEEFLPIWNEIFFLTPKNFEVYNLILRLKKRYITCLLSNINILHFEHLKKNFASLFDAFNITFLSYELGFRKPHHLIYKKILNLLSLKPEEIFYTDDRLELIEVAKKQGINSFHFTGTEKLKSDLLNIGVNIS